MATGSIRTLIVDDEPYARAGVRLQLKSEPDIEIIGECGDGEEAVSEILRSKPDLVFLDIQMPEVDGFGVVEAVGVKNMPPVIFVTAYNEHALRAFDVNALDYVLKPIDSDRFALAVQRVRERLAQKAELGLPQKLAAMLDQMRPEPRYLERLIVKSHSRIHFADVSELDWIEAADNYVRLHTGRQNHLIHGKISALEKRLDPQKFLRIHRSIIINIARIKELSPLFHGEYRIVLIDGTELTSGRTYREALRNLTENAF
jgi:two-component system, LytTR family, response regulator